MLPCVLRLSNDIGTDPSHFPLSRFPNQTLWVTEYNYDHQDLSTTQSFYNTSAEYLDRLDYVERYSLFAAFRSIVSNVGTNAAMLSAGGQLTDIGAWYLGQQSTNVDPSSTTSTGAAALLVPQTNLAVAGAVLAIAALMSL